MTKGNCQEVHHPDGIHYTVRKLAALQTFPHDLEFLGTEKENCQLIGNDVPPAFTETLFKSLIETDDKI